MSIFGTSKKCPCNGHTASHTFLMSNHLETVLHIKRFQRIFFRFKTLENQLWNVFQTKIYLRLSIFRKKNPGIFSSQGKLFLLVHFVPEIIHIDYLLY